jgi:hypothetical protein
MSAVLAFQRNSAQQRVNRARRAAEAPVEQLADNLKQAWAGHHIP